MKKPVLKRILIGLLQHLLAAGIMAAVAGLLLNSYVAVKSIDGTQVYRIFPLGAGQEFEDSDIYNDLLHSAVSDITQLVVIKEQLETNGEFDASKVIDVTDYAVRVGVDEGCAVTAEYELDDLIKWGKHGVDYIQRTMSMSDFVTYFGYCIYPENYKLNEYGELVFDDFYKITQEPEPFADDSEIQNGEQENSDPAADPSGKSSEELEAIRTHMEEFTQDQLEDLVFSHIMAEDLSEIMLNREDDGRLMVSFPMLNCRYEAKDGSRQLTDCTDNWIDYMRLQTNVAAAVEGLTESYERYQICNPVYGEGNGNVKYMVRISSEEGTRTYTNLPEIESADDEFVTEYFAEYRSYLVYYPDSLLYIGNTDIDEAQMYGYISRYEYSYPDTTHIWIGVDNTYPVAGDAFGTAYQIYDKVLPNVSRIVCLIVLLGLIWLGLAVHMSVTAGVAYNEAGDKVRYLERFDRLWTEFYVLFFAAAIYGGFLGYKMLTGIAATGGVVPAEMMGIQLNRLYHYGVFSLYGVYVSAAFGLFWYSLMRRIKLWNFWKDSLLNRILKTLSNSARFVFRHRNSVISTLLPYNLFLFGNLIGLFAAYRLREWLLPTAAVLAGVILFDGVVGVLLFKRSAEQNEIVDGINRIRDGEVEFKLDPASLHGANRELADAVNNIGEGIRKAVRTSMKDEQMKTDLITNVSHDIKTPLTSIISYVDLLKRLKIEEEPAKGYIDILDNKAQRLKQLTDDLVEASKISSGNIVLEQEKLDLAQLIDQSLGEFSEKLEELNLQVVFDRPDGPAYIYADSRRMWRVAENLFNNICKYALEGTRVYIDMSAEDGKISVSFKNISKQQMNIRPDELTERFIRGDSSRSTEGSGLGLSIAKSLVQAQGGSFEIYLDGDLFKTVIEFPEYA